uniref:Gustatory receptor n=1 Tax=Tetranychus urticae TaxID=32264 RepID=T1KKB3_TETUR
MNYIRYSESVLDNQPHDSILLRQLARHSTVQKSVDLLNYLERSGYAWLTTIRGYRQEKEIQRKYYYIGAAADIIGIILLIKCSCVVFLQDEYTRLLLGDIFIGSPSHGIQNMVLTMLLVLTVGLRYFSFLSERIGNVVILRQFHLLREKRFDCGTFMLTPVDCSLLRQVFYLLGFFYKTSNPSLSCAITGWLAYAYFSNPLNHTNWLTSITTAFWTILADFIYITATYPTVWMFAHNAMIITFAIFSLKSCNYYGQSLINETCKIKKKAIYKFLAQQNRIYNFIYQHTVDLGMLFFYGCLVVSCTGNFILFSAIFIGTGSDLFDYALVGVGALAFNSIGVMNILAAFAASKISLNRLLNYKIARRCKFNRHLSLKLLMTCERLNLTEVGFNLGGIFTLDSEHFLLYLMENASLMLMFITNFNKSSSNQQPSNNTIPNCGLNGTSQEAMGLC